VELSPLGLSLSLGHELLSYEFAAEELAVTPLAQEALPGDFLQRLLRFVPDCDLKE